MACTWEAAHNSMNVRNLMLPFPKSSRNSSSWTRIVCPIQCILCKEFHWRSSRRHGHKTMRRGSSYFEDNVS